MERRNSRGRKVQGQMGQLNCVNSNSNCKVTNDTITPKPKGSVKADRSGKNTTVFTFVHIILEQAKTKNLKDFWTSYETSNGTLFDYYWIVRNKKEKEKN